MQVVNNKPAVQVSNATYIQMKNLKTGGSAAFLTEADIKNLIVSLNDALAASTGAVKTVAMFLNSRAREANGQKWVNNSIGIKPGTGTPKA